MYVVCVTVHVKAPFVGQFIQATLDNARRTRLENGNVRFDVVQAEEDQARFMLYEVYKSKEDFGAHQQAEHYLRWKQTVADWMAQPRRGVRHRSIFFGEGES
jgi:autoinducer 2-degrading protein